MDIAVGTGAGRLGVAALLAVALAACSATRAAPQADAAPANQNESCVSIGEANDRERCPAQAAEQDAAACEHADPLTCQPSGPEATDARPALDQRRDQAPLESPSGYVRFPEALHGFWVSSVQNCSDDTEGLMEISSDQLIGYEEILKATNVTKLSDSPMSWRIDTEVDIGPSGFFSDYGPVEFTLKDGTLVSDYKPFVDAYRKCARVSDERRRACPSHARLLSLLLHSQVARFDPASRIDYLPFKEMNPTQTFAGHRRPSREMGNDHTRSPPRHSCLGG